MNKTEVLKKISDVGVVAVIRALDAASAHQIATACAAGGINALEVTFTVPGASEVIKALAQEPNLIIGAGTVLDAETARVAILNGAQFIVSPAFSLATCKLCNRYQIPYIPGCQTITEMITAMEAGADIIKLFPGSAYGPSYIKAVKGPLPQVTIMPTGGVSLGNCHEWIKNGCCAVGVGGELTAPAKTGDYQGVTDLAKKFVLAVAEARK